MDSEVNTTTTKYKQVTVDVPEERVAEFHAFFGRFLAEPSGLRRRGRHRHHHGIHGRACRTRRHAAEAQEREAAPQTAQV